MKNSKSVLNTKDIGIKGLTFIAVLLGSSVMGIEVFDVLNASNLLGTLDTLDIQGISANHWLETIESFSLVGAFVSNLLYRND